MKTKQNFLAAFSAVALAAVASFSGTVAVADGYGGGGWGGSRTATFDYGAGGDAWNEGTAYGNHVGGFSESWKEVYGGGDAVVDSHGPSGASAYAGSHFGTIGGAWAESSGWHEMVVGTGESGGVMGGGMATISRMRTGGGHPGMPGGPGGPGDDDHWSDEPDYDN